MDKDLFGEFVGLGIDAVIAFFVWRYYRRATPHERERYCTFGPRFWAPAVDGLVLWPVNIATSALLWLALPRAVAAVVFVVQNMTWLVYTVVMHVRYGQTVGKMVTKVKVVDFKTEGKISWRQGWLREGIPAVFTIVLVGYQLVLISNLELSAKAAADGGTPMNGDQAWTLLMISSMPGLWFLAEVVTMLASDKFRALHDWIAGTVVIRTNCSPVQSNSVPELAGAPPATSN